LWAKGTIIEREREIDVRRARIEDLPAILAFVNDCYGSAAPFKGERRWRWQFVDTPYPDPDGEPPVWIALDGERVVGQIALQPAKMFVHGDASPAGWIVDVMVRPQYRGMGLAHRIHDAMVASGRTLVTLNMAAATRRLAESAGAVTLPPTFELIRARRLSGDTVTRVLKERFERRNALVRGVGRLLLGSKVAPALAASAVNLATRGGSSRSPGDGVTVAAVATPDWDHADDLARRCQAAYANVFDRGADFLRWRFERAPDLKYQWAQAGRANTLCGLAAWRRPLLVELPIGVLSDVLALPADGATLDGLVEAAVSDLAGHSEAVVAGASHPAHLASLRRHGFRVFKTHRPTVVSAGGPWLEDLRSSPGTWHLTKADQDWDQVTPAP